MCYNLGFFFTYYGKTDQGSLEYYLLLPYTVPVCSPLLIAILKYLRFDAWISSAVLEVQQGYVAISLRWSVK